MTTETLFFKAEHFDSIIRISVGNRRDVIEIYKPRTLFGELEPAKINWSALGSVTPEFANRFAEAMAYAVKTANDLNEYSLIGRAEQLMDRH